MDGASGDADTRFDDAEGHTVEAFDLLKRPGLLGRLAGSDLRTRLRKAVEMARADMVLVIGGPDGRVYELLDSGTWQAIDYYAE